MRELSYEGASSGTEALTWGQRVLWRSVESYVPGEQARSLPIAVAVPDGVSRAGVLDAVRTIVLRYETLRTTFHRGRDGPVQRVAAAGAVGIGTVDAGRAEAAALAEAVSAAGAIHFPETGPPLRVTVIEDGDRPRSIVVGLSHLAVDAWGAQLVAWALGEVLAGRDLAPVCLQPRQRARWERSADGRRVGAEYVRHWLEQLARCPSTAFPGAARPTGRRPRDQAVLRSSGLAAALDAAATGLRVSAPSAVLAALALVLGARCGADGPHRFGCLVTVGHRFPPMPPHYVGTAVQHVPVVFDVTPGSFAATARAALSAVLDAVRRSQGDPDEAARVTAAVEAERGEQFHWVTVNVVGRPDVPRGPSTGGGGFERRPSGEAGGGPLELELAGDALQVAVDPVVVPPGDVELLLRTVVAVIVEAARGVTGGGVRVRPIRATGQ